MDITKIQILLINLFCLVFVWVVIYGNSNSDTTFEKKLNMRNILINYNLFPMLSFVFSNY